MGEQNTPRSSATTDAMVITFELIADEAEGDPALINAVGRDTVTSIQRDGSIVRPVYTGQRGGPFIVEIIHAIEQAMVQLWTNRAAIEEGLKDISTLVTIFNAVLPLIKHLRHAHEHQVGKDESQAHPVKIAVEIDGAPLTVEASDVTEADATLALAQRFLTAHPKEAAHVTPKSRVKVQGRVPRKPHRRRK